MNVNRLKLELFYLIKAFKYNKVGRAYLYYKYFFAPKILKSNKLFERPITDSNLSIHILTCHRDVVILLWSLATYYNVSNVIGELFIHDDGSLAESDKKSIKKFFPNSRIINDQVFLHQASHQLDRYPNIKEFRIKNKKFVLLRKLIDPYFISDKKYRLIIDSDLLWFNHPGQIAEQFEAGCNQSLMMIADTSCPVYFEDGKKFPDNLAKFNSGIVLYRQDNFDLAKLESYLMALDMNNNDNRHFIEQAGYS